ncbi:MAG: alkaline phosphatase [Parvularculaceae bacterium]|nr:alkaline phosphatase [Parvularculaceae bacterium]
MKLSLAALAAIPVFCASTMAQTPVPIAQDRYFIDGQSTLAARSAVKPNKRKAKNVILFVGDGMDITTTTAARIFDGQTRGEQGEENFLSFERFPWVALSKTYNTNAQTSDSAGTMSAMVTGVKTKIGVLSLDDRAQINDCASAKNAGVLTLGEYAERAGLATGVVTTTRLTHATPAAVYAHSPNRDWERDTNLTEEAVANGCHDIARQLIEFPFGDGLDIAMGGGRTNFLPAEAADPEMAGVAGGRRDNRDLTAEWTTKSNNHRYVWNREGFDALDPASGPRVLALFEPSHMNYEADRAGDVGGEPSLAEMTQKAIEVLRQDKDGFFLVVEGGRIDHAHHGGNAARALKDTQAFSEAVAKAVAMTNLKDTLIVVTADHGHTLTFAGYPGKGNNILGLVTASAEDSRARDGLALAADGKAYTTLGYANGPGAIGAKERPEPRGEETLDLAYRQQSAIPMGSETHGGQDVVIYANGPQAHLFGGVVEQSYIFHVIDAALDLRKRSARAGAR